MTPDKTLDDAFEVAQAALLAARDTASIRHILSVLRVRANIAVVIAKYYGFKEGADEMEKAAIEAIREIGS